MLDALRLQGEPELDAFIPELMGERQRQLEAINQLLAGYTFNGQKPPSALPPLVSQWLEKTAVLPESVERRRIDRATQLFMDHGMSLCVMLGLVSLLESYAAANGSKLLCTTDLMG